MKKLPTISLSEWLEAEQQMMDNRLTQQPKGSVTNDQFAEIKGIPQRTAAEQLYRMYKAGVATRQKWGRVYVYWPKKK